MARIRKLKKQLKKGGYGSAHTRQIVKLTKGAGVKKKKKKASKRNAAGGWTVKNFARDMAEARALVREMKRFERIHKRGEQWKAGKVGGRPALLVKRARGNPGKLRKVTGTTGWLKADAVRFVKKGGRTEVYIRRGKPRRRK